MIDTAISFLGQLDLRDAVGVFWFFALLEIPRYAIAFIATALSAVGDAWGDRAQSARWRPSVSIVLAGHNEEKAVGPCLRSLAEQTLRPFQIICVDDGSTDRMREVLRRLRLEGAIDVAVSNELRCGKPAACNLGIGFATGEVIVNVDADCSFDRDAIEKLVQPLIDPRVGAVSGNIGVRNHSRSVVTAFQAIEYLTGISVGKRGMDAIDMVACASGAFSAFRPEALREIGGLSVGPGEDLDLTLRLKRAGWAVRFAHDAWCFTDVPETLPALIRQRRRWDRDTLRLRGRKFRDALNPRSACFSLLSALDQIEFLVLNLGVTLTFPFYLAWLFYTYGTFALSLLAAVSLVYIAFDLANFTLAAFVTRRIGMLNLWPFVLGYGFFNGYVMRSVRLYAYFEEWVFRTSYRDRYVPQRVLDRTEVY